MLGFDYGYSLDEPHMLILWEAQFGDFANGAQVIIDQFIASAESKWGRASGLVMLLPHGYEGQGPEHSSARLERFLQLCAEDNIQVAVPTTPAQYFHLLRRQVRRDFRKPLVVMTPKSLLRHKLAVSPLDQFTAGRFHEVIDDAAADPDRVRRVLVCSGKVYYDLVAQREEVGKAREVAIVRLEQPYPWPAEALKAALGRYRSAREWVWVQEESQNMGGWTFVCAPAPGPDGLPVPVRRPRRQRQPGHRLARGPRARAGRAGRGRHGRGDPAPRLGAPGPPRGGPPAQARSELTCPPSPITVPGVGESITEGILSRWLKPDGAVVKAGEPLFELETDKASNVVPAAASGVLKVGVPEGTTVAIGASIGQIDPDAQPSPPAPASAPAADHKKAGARDGPGSGPARPGVGAGQRRRIGLAVARRPPPGGRGARRPRRDRGDRPRRSDHQGRRPRPPRRPRRGPGGDDRPAQGPAPRPRRRHRPRPRRPGPRPRGLARRGRG